MPSYPPSQADVKDAFLYWLNAKRDAGYEVESEPDKKERNKPAIDYVLIDKTTPRAQIALEVSTVWRSDDAGKEDAYYGKWFEAVKRNLRGRVHGSFFLMALPLAVPKAWKNDDIFADDLVQ